MRHNCRKNKLNKKTSHRNSLFKNLYVSLIQHEQIKTTLVKAKMLRRLVEPLITIAKNKTDKLSLIRRLSSVLPEYSAVKKIINILSIRYKDRPGGYTRIIRCGFRSGDSSPMAYIELVDRDINNKGLNFIDQNIKSDIRG